MPDVRRDEPCYRLIERNEGLKRVQILVVVRGDEYAPVYREIPWSLAGDFIINCDPDGGDTVGQVIDMADAQRDGMKYWENFSKEKFDAEDFTERYYRLLSERVKRLRNSSSFGPGVSIQRN
jgi:hypothetical protein